MKLSKQVWRSILAFIVAPLAGAAVLSLATLVSKAEPLHFYTLFVWLGGTALIGTVVYIFTALLVVPAYLYLIWRKRFSLVSILFVGLCTGILTGLVFRTATSNILPVAGGLIGLLSGFVFYKVHGPMSSKPAFNRTRVDDVRTG